MPLTNYETKLVTFELSFWLTKIGFNFILPINLSNKSSWWLLNRDFQFWKVALS